MNKAAQTLGRLGRGIKKRITQADSEARAARLAIARRKRWQAKTEKQTER
jgi:hypothetical protein